MVLQTQQEVSIIIMQVMIELWAVRSGHTGEHEMALVGCRRSCLGRPSPRGHGATFIPTCRSCLTWKLSFLQVDSGLQRHGQARSLIDCPPGSLLQPPFGSQQHQGRACIPIWHVARGTRGETAGSLAPQDERRCRSSVEVANKGSDSRLQ